MVSTCFNLMAQAVEPKEFGSFIQSPVATFGMIISICLLLSGLLVPTPKEMEVVEMVQLVCHRKCKSYLHKAMKKLKSAGAISQMNANDGLLGKEFPGVEYNGELDEMQRPNRPQALWVWPG